MDQIKKNWQSVSCVDDAFLLIDIGRVITSRDMDVLIKVMNPDDENKVISYFAERLAERYRDRDAAEIILESVLLWLAVRPKEASVIIFLQKILEHPERMEVIEAFPHLCMNLELVERQKKQDIFDISVFLMAQMGLQINHLAEVYPEEFSRHLSIIAQISAIMVSMSNISSFRARLSLFNYFGILELQSGRENHFKKLMDRFGSTLVNQIFHDLFETKTEAYALAYLMDNLPYVLMGSDTTQRSLQNVLRFNLLKHPLKFSLFLKVFTPHLLSELAKYSGEKQNLTLQNYLKHLTILLNVISQIDQPRLSKEILLSMCSCHAHISGRTFVRHITQSGDIRLFYRELLSKLISAKDSRQYLESLSKFRHNQRQPVKAFVRLEVGVFDQIYTLGQSHRASAQDQESLEPGHKTEGTDAPKKGKKRGRKKKSHPPVPPNASVKKEDARGTKSSASAA